MLENVCKIGDKNLRGNRQVSSSSVEGVLHGVSLINKRQKDARIIEIFLKHLEKDPSYQGFGKYNNFLEMPSLVYTWSKKDFLSKRFEVGLGYDSNLIHFEQFLPESLRVETSREEIQFSQTKKLLKKPIWKKKGGLIFRLEEVSRILIRDSQKADINLAEISFGVLFENKNLGKLGLTAYTMNNSNNS